MKWNEIECNELLNRVYNTPPEIGEIDIFDIEIRRDGLTVIVTFDLVDSVPDNPPIKWGKDFNRCRMGIYCTGVSNLLINGLSTNIIAKINFTTEHGLTHVTICSESFMMSLKCTSISVTGPSVYKSVETTC